jgi:hypothetical protein
MEKIKNKVVRVFENDEEYDLIQNILLDIQTHHLTTQDIIDGLKRVVKGKNTDLFLK